MSNQGFNLEKFAKVFKSEYEELPDQLKSMKLHNLEGSNFKKTLKYYHDKVYKTIKGNYFVQVDGEPFKVEAMSSKTWNEVYGNTIKEFCPNLLKKDTVRYSVDIYDEHFTVCKESKRINVARPFNYAKNEMELIEEEQELLNELLDEFIFKVICASNKEQYEFILNMLSCYMHRKQSEIILILVGEAGTGKSKFIELLQELFGQSCKMMSDQVLSGQDMFNGSMVGTSVGYIEETNGKGESNYTDIQRTLKRLSTSRFLSCRQMQTEAYDVPNIINFAVVTNFVKDIKHDRRNFTLEPSTHRMNDKIFYGKMTKIINNKRIMQALFNMLYNRNHKVWEDRIPTTEVMTDFVEGSAMKPIHEFLIDEFIHNTNKDKMYLGQLFDTFKNYIATTKDAKFNPNETIFKHEARQILTKLALSTGNKIWYDTSRGAIMEALAKRKITEEMIEKRNPTNIFEENDTEENEYDITDQQKREINDLKALVKQQAETIARLQSALEKGEVEHEVKKAKVKKSKEKFTTEALQAFENMRSYV